MEDNIAAFFESECYAVAGASTKPEKYGNKVFRALVGSGRKTFPLNPAADTVEGSPAFASLADCPVVPDALSLVTPPAVTRKIIEEAIELGVKHFWMQPGAEDEHASALARDAGCTVIDDGSCILVLLARM